MNEVEPTSNASCGYSGSRFMWGYLILGVIAIYFLLTEHLAHTIAYLPFLLFLACPLMHLFMHHGHHHKHHADEHSSLDVNKKVDE